MAIVHHHAALSTTAWIAIYGAVVATGTAIWNVIAWRWSHAFDVRVTVEQHPYGIAVGSGKYEITVVARNHGRTQEAVQEIWLLYPEHQPDDPAVTIPSVRVPMPASELAPNHNVRKSIDLLASRFAPFPTELTAVVLLESGRHVRSKPFRPTRVEFARRGPSAGD